MDFVRITTLSNVSLMASSVSSPDDKEEQIQMSVQLYCRSFSCSLRLRRLNLWRIWAPASSPSSPTESISRFVLNLVHILPWPADGRCTRPLNHDTVFRCFRSTMVCSMWRRPNQLTGLFSDWICFTCAFTLQNTLTFNLRANFPARSVQEGRTVAAAVFHFAV